MNTKISKLALALGALVMAGGAMALDNATATATADVLTPIAITKNADMVFGNVVPGNGDVTLSTSAARTKSGTTALSVSGATPAAAQFTVTGTGSNTFAIDYTGSSATLVNGSDTMAIDWITEVVASGAATGKTDSTTDPLTGTLAVGSATIWAGAKLTVGAAQVAGAYTGDLKITVAYN